MSALATAMRAGMSVEQLAEMQFAYPTFTEAVSMAAQKVCRAIGIGQFPPAWSYLGPESSLTGDADPGLPFAAAALDEFEAEAALDAQVAVRHLAVER